MNNTGIYRTGQTINFQPDEARMTHLNGEDTGRLIIGETYTATIARFDNRGFDGLWFAGVLADGRKFTSKIATIR